MEDRLFLYLFSGFIVGITFALLILSDKFLVKDLKVDNIVYQQNGQCNYFSGKIYIEDDCKKYKIGENLLK